MPPPLLFDLSSIDLQTEPVFDREAICKVNPQRFEMQHLDGILWVDKDKRLLLGYKDVTDSEFWIRGAGINSAKFRSVVEPGQKLYLLGHITKFKCRRDTAHVTTNVQGVVDGAIVFETTISGMKV